MLKSDARAHHFVCHGQTYNNTPELCQIGHQCIQTLLRSIKFLIILAKMVMRLHLFARDFSEILHNQIFDIFKENILLRETQTHHRFGCFPIILVQSGDASASLCPGYFSENLHNQIFDFLRKYPIEKDADASPIW